MAKVSSYAVISTLLEGMYFYTSVDTDSDGIFESRRASLASVRLSVYDTKSLVFKLSKGADVASAAALGLGTDGNSFDITGTTTITSIDTVAVGAVVVLQFDGILTLTHHATNLILPGGVDITTAAGDMGMFTEYAAGKWRCINYSRAAAIVVAKVGADVASAAALPLLKDGNYFDVIGTTAITSMNSTGIGSNITLQFDGALTLTHHATNLILPGGANITTAAGDHATFVEYAAGTWRCVNYMRASALPVLQLSAGKVYPIYMDAAAQALSGPGAVDVTSPVTNYTSTGATDALTLADSTLIGQVKVINHEVDGGGYVLTPTTFANGTTITVTALSTSITLMWGASGWRLIGQTGAATIA